MKPRYIFILAVALAILSIFGLRYNGQKASDLRAAVRNKDTQNQDTKAEIEALRKFVFTHMNSSIRFELTSGYDRAVTLAKQASSTSGDADLYAQAQTTCDQPGVGSVAQAQCVQDFLSARLQPGQNPQAKLPDRTLYNYAFVSPSWTADFAGLTLLSSVLLAFTSLILYIWSLFKVRAKG